MKKLLSISNFLICILLMQIMTSCSNDEGAEKNKLNVNKITLTAGQETVLVYDGECTWSSDNSLIAEVNDNGVVTAHRVGETNINANNESCRVTVVPRYNTYEEPTMNWGFQMSEVKKIMKDYTLLSEDDDILFYLGEGAVLLYGFHFTNDKLDWSSISADFLESGEEILEFLDERYVPIDFDEENLQMIFISLDEKVLIGYQVDLQNGILNVLYMPISEEQKLNTKLMQMKQTYSNQNPEKYMESKKLWDKISKKYSEKQ